MVEERGLRTSTGHSTGCRAAGSACHWEIEAAARSPSCTLLFPEGRLAWLRTGAQQGAGSESHRAPRSVPHSLAMSGKVGAELQVHYVGEKQCFSICTSCWVCSAFLEKTSSACSAATYRKHWILETLAGYVAGTGIYIFRIYLYTYFLPL